MFLKNFKRVVWSPIYLLIKPLNRNLSTNYKKFLIQNEQVPTVVAVKWPHFQRKKILHLNFSLQESESVGTKPRQCQNQSTDTNSQRVVKKPFCHNTCSRNCKSGGQRRVEWHGETLHRITWTIIHVETFSQSTFGEKLHASCKEVFCRLVFLSGLAVLFKG